MQTSDCSLAPLQSKPPKAALFLDRTRYLVPPPQLTVQVLHAFQAFQVQSTGLSGVSIILVQVKFVNILHSTVLQLADCVLVGQFGVVPVADLD